MPAEVEGSEKVELADCVGFHTSGSLAVVSGTHGTHVAAIIGGRVEDEPELSGVAPGVEIVSLQIGDARLAALETGQALMRATKAILFVTCDFFSSEVIRTFTLN